MQDPTIAAAFPQLKQPQFPEQEQLKCPRCESTNTKFCYYNNYNLSQPRHFCKNCRRYWTKGGALRNIPVGGGSRKNTKRSSKQLRPPSLPQTPTTGANDTGLSPSLGLEHKPVPMIAPGIGTGLGLPAPAAGSFTSLLGLASEGGTGQFGSFTFLQGLNHNGLKVGHESGAGQDTGLKLMQEDSSGGSATSEGLIMGLGNGNDHYHHHQMQSCWGAASNNGWPDLAIYTPGSKFQ